MHQHIQTTNAIESLFSNVHQRTDQINVFMTEPGDCLGHNPGYPLTQTLALILLKAESGKSSQQPAREGGSGGAVFAPQETRLPATQVEAIPLSNAWIYSTIERENKAEVI